MLGETVSSGMGCTNQTRLHWISHWALEIKNSGGK